MYRAASATGAAKAALTACSNAPTLPTYYNTATGAFALRATTTGANNTATGIHALTANTTGFNNTALGVGNVGGGHHWHGEHGYRLGCWGLSDQRQPEYLPRPPRRGE